MRSKFKKCKSFECAKQIAREILDYESLATRARILRNCLSDSQLDYTGYSAVLFSMVSDFELDPAIAQLTVRVQGWLVTQKKLDSNTLIDQHVFNRWLRNLCKTGFQKISPESMFSIVSHFLQIKAINKGALENLLESEISMLSGNGRVFLRKLLEFVRKECNQTSKIKITNVADYKSLKPEIRTRWLKAVLRKKPLLLEFSFEEAFESESELLRQHLLIKNFSCFARCNSNDSIRILRSVFLENCERYNAELTKDLLKLVKGFTWPFNGAYQLCLFMGVVSPFPVVVEHCLKIIMSLDLDFSECAFDLIGMSPEEVRILESKITEALKNEQVPVKDQTDKHLPFLSGDVRGFLEKSREEKLSLVADAFSEPSEHLINDCSELLECETDLYVIAKVILLLPKAFLHKAEFESSKVWLSYLEYHKHTDSRIRANFIEGLGILNSHLPSVTLEFSLKLALDSDNRVCVNAIRNLKGLQPELVELNLLASLNRATSLNELESYKWLVSKLLLNSQVSEKIQDKECELNKTDSVCDESVAARSDNLRPATSRDGAKTDNRKECEDFIDKKYSELRLHASAAISLGYDVPSDHTAVAISFTDDIGKGKDRQEDRTLDPTESSTESGCRAFSVPRIRSNFAQFDVVKSFENIEQSIERQMLLLQELLGRDTGQMISTWLEKRLDLHFTNAISFADAFSKRLEMGEVSDPPCEMISGLLPQICNELFHDVSRIERLINDAGCQSEIMTNPDSVEGLRSIILSTIRIQSDLNIDLQRLGQATENLNYLYQMVHQGQVAQSDYENQLHFVFEVAGDLAVKQRYVLEEIYRRLAYLYLDIISGLFSFLKGRVSLSGATLESVCLRNWLLKFDVSYVRKTEIKSWIEEIYAQVTEYRNLSLFPAIADISSEALGFLNVHFALRHYRPADLNKSLLQYFSDLRVQSFFPIIQGLWNNGKHIEACELTVQLHHSTQAIPSSTDDQCEYLLLSIVALNTLFEGELFEDKVVRILSFPSLIARLMTQAGKGQKNTEYLEPSPIFKELAAIIVYYLNEDCKVRPAIQGKLIPDLLVRRWIKKKPEITSLRKWIKNKGNLLDNSFEFLKYISGNKNKKRTFFGF